MEIFKLKKFTRGWVAGDFEPAILKTKDFEFAVQYYKKGEAELPHVHKIADEISVVVYGRFRMNGQILKPGDAVWLRPGDPADFACLEDGATAVIKRPSVIGDKYDI
jgi:hypothetical protein